MKNRAERNEMTPSETQLQTAAAAPHTSKLLAREAACHAPHLLDLEAPLLTRDRRIAAAPGHVAEVELF